MSQVKSSMLVSFLYFICNYKNFFGFVFLNKFLFQDKTNPLLFENKWPNMRPIVLKLLQQECVTQNEWHDLFFSVHSVCLWDEKGGTKVMEALRKDITDFIKQAQQVSFIYCNSYNFICR